MPNYMTPAGYKKLAEELTRLRTVDRPKVCQEVSDAAAQGDRSENAEYIYGTKRMREIDRRVRFLQKRLDGLLAMDVDAPRATDKAYFGAWVTVEDGDGEERTVRILGPDEVEADKGFISYQSPLGRALLGKRPGDEVVVKSPSGDRAYSVTDVQYGARIALRDPQVRGKVRCWMLRYVPHGLLGALLSLLPAVALLLSLAGCGRGDDRTEIRKLAEHGLSVATPAGWTGGGAGGTYEYRSADGSARLRIAPLEGATATAGLKDAQLLAGTGVTPVSRNLPPSPTRVGALPAERGRFTGNDGRVYDVVAVQTQRGVVLFQTSVTADRATSAEVERLFTMVRQSIQVDK